MNSYQTVNAAAHIAGIPRRHAVSFGQAYHAGHYQPVKSFEELVWREQIARLDAMFGVNRKEGAYNPVVQDYSQLEARVSAFQSEGWDERVATGKDRHRAGLTTGRDQSEDRPAPKFLVAYRQVTANYGYYEVLRADDRFVWDDHLDAEGAAEVAARREREWAGRGRPRPAGESE